MINVSEIMIAFGSLRKPELYIYKNDLNKVVILKTNLP